MNSHENQRVGAESICLKIIWRNPLAVVQAQLRINESRNHNFGWAERASEIRVRRANWNANHRWEL